MHYITLALLLLAGCVIPVRTDAPLMITRSPERIPVNMGIYYPLDFIDHKEQIGGADILIGAASVNLFDQAARSLFAKASPVSRRPPLTDRVDVQGVIEPRIEAFDFRSPEDFAGVGIVARHTAAQPYAAAIRYRFVVYDRAGGEIASWVVIGKKLTLGDSAARSSVIDAALQDATLRFMQTFREVPAITAWVKELPIR
jgi:hypothetical protein